MGVTELSEKTRRHLELEYQYDPCPNDKTKSALSLLTGLDPEEVGRWFERREQGGNTALVSSRRSSLGDAASSGSPEIQRRRKARAALDEFDQAWNPERTQEIFASPLPALPAITDNDIPTAVISNADVKTNSPLLDMVSEIATERIQPRGRLIDESNLPGYQVLDLNLNRRQPRQRRKFTMDQRYEVAMVRARGACVECKRKKLKCLHTLASDRLASVGLPSLSVQKSTSPSKSPALDSREIVNLEPWFDKDPEEYLGFVTSQRSSTDFPMNGGRGVEVRPPLHDSAFDFDISSLSPQHNHSPNLSEEVIVLATSPSHHDLSPYDYPSKPGDPWVQALSSPATATRPTAGICKTCGFTPGGDPKWHKSNLLRHMRDQHSEKTAEHACPFPGCAHVYRRSDNLSVHIRKHHNESVDHRLASSLASTDPTKTMSVASKETSTSNAEKPATVQGNAKVGPGSIVSHSGAKNSTEKGLTFIFSDGTG